MVARDGNPRWIAGFPEYRPERCAVFGFLQLTLDFTRLPVSGSAPTRRNVPGAAGSKFVCAMDDAEFMRSEGQDFATARGDDGRAVTMPCSVRTDAPISCVTADAPLRLFAVRSPANAYFHTTIRCKLTPIWVHVNLGQLNTNCPGALGKYGICLPRRLSSRKYVYSICRWTLNDGQDRSRITSRGKTS
jgi:hypothetical protein